MLVEKVHVVSAGSSKSRATRPMAHRGSSSIFINSARDMSEKPVYYPQLISRVRQILWLLHFNLTTIWNIKIQGILRVCKPRFRGL